MVVQREGRVPQRVDEVAREPAPVVVGRVGETVTAAPATDEVEERVDVPVVRHDVAGQGLDSIAVEQVADARVETAAGAVTERTVQLGAERLERGGVAADGHHLLTAGEHGGAGRAPGRSGGARHDDDPHGRRNRPTEPTEPTEPVAVTRSPR